MESMQSPIETNSIWQIFYQTFTSPRVFFKNRFQHVTTSQALVVGALSVFVKALLVWMVSSLKNESYLDHFKKILDQAKDIPAIRMLPLNDLANINDGAIPSWILNFGGLTLTPFTALINILVFSFFLTIGNAIFGKSEHTWDSFFKLAALGNVPLVLGGFLSFLPFGFGEGLASLYCSILVLIGLVDAFKMDGLRAVLIVYATPMIGLLLCGCFVALPLGFLVASFF
jgi:hypothetical protein